MIKQKSQNKPKGRNPLMFQNVEAGRKNIPLVPERYTIIEGLGTCGESNTFS